MNRILKQTLVAMTITASLGGATNIAYGAADPGLAFKVQEGVVAGTPNNVINATSFLFNYNEDVIATSASTFAASGAIQVTNFRLNGEVVSTPAGGSQDQYLGAPGAQGYNLYALFSFLGTVTGVSGGGFQFVATAGAISLYTDPGKDTTLTSNNDGTVAYTRGGTTVDDVLLATAATVIAGDGNTNNTNTQQGAFRLVFSDFLLTPAGTGYFFDPAQFWMVLNAGGEVGGLANFNLSGANFKAQGGGTGFFTPEPGSIALAGLVLVGVAAFGAGRRRKQV